MIRHDLPHDLARPSAIDFSLFYRGIGGFAYSLSKTAHNAGIFGKYHAEIVARVLQTPKKIPIIPLLCCFDLFFDVSLLFKNIQPISVGAWFWGASVSASRNRSNKIEVLARFKRQARVILCRD